MKIRKLKKALKRLEGRIKDFEKMKQTHEGEYHKPGRMK